MPQTTELNVDPSDIADEYDRAGLSRLSDAQLFDIAASVVAVPREAPANFSFSTRPFELICIESMSGRWSAEVGP